MPRTERWIPQLEPGKSIDNGDLSANQRSLVTVSDRPVTVAQNNVFDMVGRGIFGSTQDTFAGWPASWKSVRKSLLGSQHR